MLLQVNHLSFGYNNSTLIGDLSFQVDRPSFIAIIGHNGSGKSTFFKTLTSRQPYSGNILIKGQDLQKINNLLASGLISCLDQKNNLSFDIKVIDLVMMGRFRFKSFFQDYDLHDKDIARLALQSLDILHLEDKDFLSLSGGEQQLVWLAQLSLQDADMVLLDEPTQQLDLYNKKRMFDEMERWVESKGKLVMCVTHDIQNLYDMNGYFINFSDEKPSLQELNKDNLDRQIQILQSKSSKRSITEVL